MPRPARRSNSGLGYSRALAEFWSYKKFEGQVGGTFLQSRS